MMPTTTPDAPSQRSQPQPQSKILDADFDAASILSESALLSRHCADRSEHSGIDCYKICRTHSDVSQLASTLLITIGTQSLHTKSHWPATATSASPSTYEPSFETAPSSTSQQGHELPFHIRADAMIKSLDLAPLLSLVQETAKRARAVCAAHMDCSHCQACAQCAAQVEVLVHSLLSKEAAKKHTTETASASLVGTKTACEQQQRGGKKTGNKGKRSATQQHHDEHEKREAEIKTLPADSHGAMQTKEQVQPPGKPESQKPPTTKTSLEDSMAPTVTSSPSQSTSAPHKRNPRRKPRGGTAARSTESFKGGQHEHTVQAMLSTESTLDVSGDSGSGMSQAAAFEPDAAALAADTPRVRRPSMHEAFPLGTAEGQKYDTDQELRNWEQMNQQGLGGGLELGTAEGQKVGMTGLITHHDTGTPGGGGVQLGLLDQETVHPGQTEQAGKGAVEVTEAQRVKVKEE